MPYRDDSLGATSGRLTGVSLARHGTSQRRSASQQQQAPAQLARACVQRETVAASWYHSFEVALSEHGDGFSARQTRRVPSGLYSNIPQSGQTSRSSLADGEWRHLLLVHLSSAHHHLKRG